MTLKAYYRNVNVTGLIAVNVLERFQHPVSGNVLRVKVLPSDGKRKNFVLGCTNEVLLATTSLIVQEEKQPSIDGHEDFMEPVR